MDEALIAEAQGAEDESAVGSRQSTEDQFPVPSSQSPEDESNHQSPGLDPIADIEDPPEVLAEHLLDVNVRVWAELGRSQLPLAQAVALGTGAIVDLDKEPDEALDVYVNGRLFAKGRLLLVDGEWAVRLEQIVAGPGAVEHASSSGSEA